MFGFLIAILSFAIFLFLFWRFYFLRDPERKVPSGKNIVSPADGKVIEVFEASNKTRVKKGIGGIRTMLSEVSDECFIVAIFMSPFDVHINRAPMAGKIVSIRHSSGKFKPVMSLEAALENEKSEMLLDTGIGKIKVIQVAGIVARRIVNFRKAGQILKKGERYGLINLGSQLIIILPKNAVYLKVSVGEKVKAGQTVIAEY